MNIQAEKLSVLEQIINTDDIALIKEIKAILSNRDLDWFDGLNRTQKADVMEGIAQLDNGDVFSHEDAKKRFGYK